jgi:excisionase family DNA binding protein
MTSPREGKFFDRQPTGSIELLTVAQAAKLLGVSASGMRRLQQDRRVPFFKVGRCVRFAKSDLAAYLTKRRVESIGQ